MLRFQLVSDSLGTEESEGEDPIGINELSKSIKRSELYEGVVFEILLNVPFIKRKREFIKLAYETTGGIDAIVGVNIYELNRNTRKWELWFTGQMNFNSYELTEDQVTVNIDKTGMQRDVLNLKDVDVDLETTESINGVALPAQSTLDVVYHSKAILKENYNTPIDSAPYQALSILIFSFPNTGADATIGEIFYAQVSNEGNKDIKQLQDLTEHFQTPWGWTPFENLGSVDQLGGIGTIPNYIAFLQANGLGIRNPNLVADEKGTAEIHLKFVLKHKVSAVNTIHDVDVSGGGSTCLGHIEVFAWVEKRSKDNTIIFIDPVGSWDMATNFGNDSNEGVFESKTYDLVGDPVNIGDKYYFYLTYRVWGVYQTALIPFSSSAIVTHDFEITGDHTLTFQQIKSRTISDPSTVKTILIYEAIERCLQYITNKVDCFYSELLGRVDLGYAEDGEYALIGTTTGNRLRKNNKTQFDTLSELLALVNSLTPIGFKFQIIDGIEKFNLVRIAEIYDKTTTILSLGRVYMPKKRINEKRYHVQIEYGYSNKIDIQQVNGIDAFNTVRRQVEPIRNSKNKASVACNRAADGYQIESQRRLNTTTKDGRLDEAKFIVVLIRDGDDFKTKKDEGYAQILNVYDSGTGYNYDISPARLYKNHLVVIAAGLTRSIDKTTKFSYGEVNYLMATRKNTEAALLYENGDVDLKNVVPIWDNENYLLENVPFSSNQVKLLSQNPYGVIEFQDQFGETFEGFVTSEPITTNGDVKSATLNLMKVFR